MTSLAEHQSSQFTKILYIGNSSTGKTGSLVSLVADGYKLRILDLDNGLDSLKAYVKKQCPDKLGNIDYETQRDSYKVANGQLVLNGPAKAFANSVKLLDKWSDESTPAEWGPDTIFVLDSLTRLGDAAFEWAKAMNPGAKDPRQWYGQAQAGVESVLSMLTDPRFATNVIVISHVKVSELPDGTVKGYVSAIGQALGATIPTYFNTLVLAESAGSGDNVKRKIKTVPTSLVDLKTPAPFAVPKDLPLETGLSTLFKTLKDN